MSSHQQPSGDHCHQSGEIEAMVKYQGFALFHIPHMTYTIGMHSQPHPLPELLLSGLSKRARIAWLLDLGFQMKGPPSREAQIDEARARGLPLQRVREQYPTGGTRFEPGVLSFLAQGDRPATFGIVETQYYQQALWHACAHHGNKEFVTLQYVWTDPASRFPWEKGYDQGRFPQQLLFDPRPLLPLRQPEG